MSGKQNPVCQGKDTFERMNFLYQAGALMSPVNSTLSCYYGQLCRAVAKKAVLRMLVFIHSYYIHTYNDRIIKTNSSIQYREPAIKRTICKRCGNVLIPGTSSDIEISPNNPKLCEIKCRKCGCLRRFTMTGEYRSWLDDPQSIRDRLSIDSLTKVRIEPAKVQSSGKRKADPHSQ